MNAILRQHVLELRKLPEKSLALLGRAEIEDLLHDARLYQDRSNRRSRRRGQMLHIALEIPVRASRSVVSTAPPS